MSKKPAPAFSPFVLDLAATFRWPVVVRVPSDQEVGKKIKTKFIAGFRHVSEERRMEILREHRQALAAARTPAPADADEGQEDQASDTELAFSLSQKVLAEVLDRCYEIEGPDRQLIEWSPEVKRVLITHQMVWPALYAAYMEAIAQQDPAGNSQPSR